MKKLIGILMVLLISILPSVLADDSNETIDVGEDLDNETLEEVQAMNNQNGAEMRLLQLEKSIERNILTGEYIIKQATELGKDTSELEMILEEMQILKEDVQNADPASEDVVETFIGLKADARELSKQFRDTLNGIVEPGEMGDIKAGIGDALKEDEGLKEYNNQIREKTKAHNALMLGTVLEILNIENADELTSNITSKEDLKGIHDAIRDKLKNMTQEEKKESLGEMKEAGVKRAVAVKAKIQRYKISWQEKKIDRLNGRFEKLEQRMNATAEKFQNFKDYRLGVVEDRIGNMTERLDHIKEIRDNRTSKIISGAGNK